jgi:hypothetical protein
MFVHSSQARELVLHHLVEGAVIAAVMLIGLMQLSLRYLEFILRAQQS